MTRHYELEVKNPTTKLWVRQKHDRHDTLDAASDSAYDVRRFAKRETRIVEVTTDERIVHDPHTSTA